MERELSNHIPNSIDYERGVDSGIILERLLRIKAGNIDSLDTHPFPHFMMHIPKTGGYYVHPKISTLLFNSPKYQALRPDERFRLCQLANGHVDGYLMESYKGVNCTAWMSERPYLNRPKNVYTIIRNPREHVLSQYFMCTESKEHPINYGKHKMPSLQDWLFFWAYAKEGRSPIDFGCFDPRNFASAYSKFRPELDTISDLQKKFTVIAPMDEMDAAICVIFLHYTGWIPPPCNCTLDGALSRGEGGHHGGEDHGVKHHGSSFNTTTYQNELIDLLTQKDQILYKYAKEIFQQQKRLTEEMFEVVICSKFKKK